MRLSLEDINLLRERDKRGVKIMLPLPLKDVKNEFFIKNKVISAIKILPTIPLLIEGKWFHIFLFVSTRFTEEVKERIKKEIKYVTEIFINESIPINMGHHITFEIFTPDLSEIEERVRDIKEIEEYEIKAIKEFNFQNSYSLSPIDKALLKRIHEFKSLELNIFEDILEEFGEEEVLLSLDGLFNKRKELYSPPFLLTHDIFWYNIENFLHTHFVFGKKPDKDTERFLIDEDFQPVGEVFKRFYHYEKDMYSFKDLHQSFRTISQIDREGELKFKGIIFYRSHLVNEEIFDIVFSRYFEGRLDKSK